MFSFFKKKPSAKLIVTQEDKQWVEANLEWMMQQYGVRPLLLAPVTTETGPFGLYHDRVPKKLRYFMDKVCERMDVDPEDVALFLYNAAGMDAKDRAAGVHYEGTYSQGEYHHRNNLTGKFDIHINQKIVGNLQALLSTMAHEIGHVKLLGEYRTTAQDEFHEYLTDLTAIYFGFGITMANTCNTRETWQDGKGNSGWSIGKAGYLPMEVIVYAVAVQAYLQGRTDPEWADAFGKAPAKLFRQSLAWLHETRDCGARFPQARGGRAMDV